MIDLLDDPAPLHSGAPWWLLANGIAEPAERPRNRCQVAVIGAGVTGAMVADHLSASGLDVMLIDRRTPGHGSTAVSTALVQYDLDTLLFRLMRQIGPDDAVRAYRMGADAVAELGHIVATLGDDCGFAQRPSLYLATSKPGMSDIAREEEARTAAGLDVALWTAAQVHDRYGLPSRGALRNEHAAVVDPVRLTRALLDRAVERGAGLMPRTTVTRVVEGSRGFVVETDHGDIRADQVVLAIGYEVPRTLLGDGVTRASTFAAVSAPLDDLGQLSDGCLVWETRRPYTYLRTTDDRRVLIGGGDVEFASADARDRLLPARTRMLQRKLDQMVPSLACRIEFAWAGTFVSTEDGLPIIGPVEAAPAHGTRSGMAATASCSP